MRSRSLTLVAAGGLALVAGGCGTKTVDADKLEESVAESLSASKGVDPSTISIDCPDDQSGDKGSTFDCTLTAEDGSTAKVVVTFTNDEGHYTATVPRDQFQ